MLIQALKENELIYQDTYLESSHIHQLTVLFCFEHRNHDVLLI